MKPQWEQAADIVVALGHPSSVDDVWKDLKKVRADIPRSTVAADLAAVAVNSPSRTSYDQGKNCRRTDSGNRYDRLFKIGAGAKTRYVPYDASVHGVWEIYPDPNATSTYKVSIRRVDTGAFNAEAAVSWLDQRYPKTRSGTTHIVAFSTPAGRELALDPGANPAKKTTLKIFVDAVPPYVSKDTVKEYSPERTRNHHLRNHAPSLALGNWAFAVPVSTMAELKSLCDWYEGGRAVTADQTDAEQTSMDQPTNRILYGPPGTGKTYRTIDEALAILDPSCLAEHGSDQPEDRAMLKQRFDELVDARRIRFVTFHQSFSYEDFVEGIRAMTDETNGSLRYEVEDGVFKQLCEAARSRTVAGGGADFDIKERRIWKISLGDANSEGYIFDECMEKSIALMGFGFGADLTGASSQQEVLERVRAVEETAKPGDYAFTALDQFIHRMREGDLLVVTHGNLKFRAIGEVAGPYQYMGDSEHEHYRQARPVRWLRQYDPPRPYSELMENRFSQRTIYELRPGSINLDRLASLLAPESEDKAGGSASGPRVLIIDEINRGNISRIFGELITLIEPSKREGAAEALEVTLPYSKERFSVPSNLHLIGTMNTADRSLAGLDIALRRRFEFVEMMPDIGALAGIVVDGIPIDVLLSTMNRHIEVLLGRDYMLGHAYFMKLKDTPTLEALAEVFRRQVLPLLQEYFFEDWQKIAWVLNDHRKPEALQFVRQEKLDAAELLGDGIELPRDGRLWRINPDAFLLPEAYRAVINAPQAFA